MSSVSSGASSPTSTYDGLPDTFDGLVIGVSGAIPGKKHKQIERMVKKVGATFEGARHRTECTHLITTPRAIKTKKVREARAKNCDIVSIDWLIKSMKNMESLDTNDFLIKFPDPESDETETSIGGAQVGEKRKRDCEPDCENDGPAKKLRVVSPNENDKWAAIVEEDFRLQQKNLIVWNDREGIWDATLVKEYTADDESLLSIRTSFYRIQLLFDVEGKKYYTHIRRDPSGQHKLCEVKGTGDLETAQKEFRKSIEDATGLPWEKRADAPQEDREIFVECSYEGEVGDGSTPAQSKTASSASVLSEPVQDVLSMLFGANQRPAIRNLLDTFSTGRLKVNRDQVTNHTVRVGTALLDKICNLPRNSNGELNADNSTLADRLSRCYVGLMFDNKGSVPSDADWIQKEREILCFLRNLIWVQKVLDESSRPMALEQFSVAHQKLCFPTMTPLGQDTNEYKLLDKHFQSSISVTHSNGVVKYKETPGKVLNIFRLDRASDQDQLEKWTAANQVKAGERRLLWHGSPTANFIGILSQGLRPNIFPSTGSPRMFGDNGIYLADMVGKSIRDCLASPGEMGLMLLCEVEVGHTMKSYYDAACNAEADVKTSNSCAVFGQGSTFHDGWCDAVCLHSDLKGIKMPDVEAGKSFNSNSTLAHNEYVVYDPAQVRQRYLVQFQMH